MPALDLGPHLGYADALQQQFLLLPEIGHGVVGEGLDLLREALPGVLQLCLENLGGVEAPAATTVPSADSTRPSSMVTRSPSCTEVKIWSPTLSISGIPASIKMPGPRFG